MMSLTSHKSVRRWCQGAFYRLLSLALAGGVLTLAAAHAYAQQQPDQSKGGMAGMDMSGAGDMGDMGSSMAAMAGHMYITPLRPRQPGDEEKAKAVVAQVKASSMRYKDYRNAPWRSMQTQT